jgi:hypothetical protein
MNGLQNIVFNGILVLYVDLNYLSASYLLEIKKISSSQYFPAYSSFNLENETY